MPSQLLRGSAAEATTHLTLAFNGTVPGNAIYSSYTAEFARVGEFALANSFAASYANETNAALATRVLSNLGVTATTIGQSSYATLASAVETAFAAYPSARGQVALNLARLLAGLEGDATYGAAATTWNNSAATAFTYSSNAANTTATTIAALNAAATTGRQEALSTSVERVSGSAFDDIFTAVQQASGSTLNAGDQIAGGGGNDTLNLILRADPSDVPAVQLDGVESVIVNNQATDATGGQLDASLWSGVTLLSNAGSTGATLLSVSGLALSTVVRGVGNTDLTISHRGDLTGSADTVSVGLENFGTGTGTVATDTGVLTIGTGVDVLNIGAVGTAYLSIEAGDTLRTVNYSGNAALTLTTDELLTSFNASGLTATSDFTFSGTSDLAFNGGAGNDTIRLGGTISNGDSINGGGGTDTVVASISGDVSLNATSIEVATLTFNAATGDLTLTNAQSITNLDLRGVAGPSGAGSVVNWAGGTATLGDDLLTAITIDTVAGATVTLALGTASVAGVDLASARITDAATVQISNRGGTGSAGVNTLSQLVLSNTVTTLGVTAQGSAGLTITDLQASALTSLNVVAVGSGSANIDAAIASTAISSISLRAIGSTASDITLTNAFAAGSAVVTSLVAEASAGAAIVLPAMNLGTGATGAAVTSTITVAAGVDSDVGGTAFDLTAEGIETINLNITVGASGSAIIGDIVSEDVVPGTNVTLAISAGSIGSAGYLEIDKISASAGLNLVVGPISVGEGGLLVLGGSSMAFSTGSIGRITLAENAGARVGSAGIVATDLGTVALTMGTGSTATIGTAAANSGAYSVTVGIDASAVFATAAIANVGESVITLSQSAELDAAAITAVSGIASLTVTVGTNASAVFTDIAVTGSTVSGLNVVVRSGGEFDVSSIFASSMPVTATFGVAAAGTAQVDTISMSGSLAKIVASGAGSIQLGTITVSGGLAVELQNTSAFSATFAQTGALTLTGGAGVNNIVLSQAGSSSNVLVLATGGSGTGVGTDTIKYVTAAVVTDGGADEIRNFQVGSGGDTIVLGSAINGGSGLRASNGATGGTGVAASAQLSVSISGATTLTAGDNVIRLATAFANTAAMLTFVQTQITFNTALAGSGEILVMYNVNTADTTYLAMLNVSGAGSGTTLVSGDVSLVQTLVKFTGASAGGFTANNIMLGG